LKEWVEDNILSNIPGYTLLKGMSETAVGLESNNLKEVVLVDIEEVWQIGFLMERLDDDKTVVICTDIEHGNSILPEIVEFCKGADLLVHEAQYTSKELESHRGWGHSSYNQALEVAEKAGVKRLAITHHDPEHDDKFLANIEKECQKRFSNCVLARENMEIVL